MYRKLLASLCLLPTLLSATETMPWFSPSLEFQSRLTLYHQHYDETNGGSCIIPYGSDDWFVHPSLLLAYDIYSGEAEMYASQTEAHTFSPDSFKLTFRTLLMDDVIGEPFSFCIGISGLAVLDNGLHDPSSFYHGNWEAEFFASIGKECACESDWLFRYYATGGFGIANMGSSWVFGRAAIERNYCEIQIVRLFVETLYGLGGENLDLSQPFLGYGSINHQSIDIGARYSYLTDWDVTVSLEYAMRIHARNAPSELNRYLIQFLYPFGL